MCLVDLLQVPIDGAFRVPCGPGAFQHDRDRSGWIEGFGGGQKGSSGGGSIHGDSMNENKEHFLVRGGRRGRGERQSGGPRP